MGTYDVAIIGTDAGSGTLARHLATSLLLARGDRLPRAPCSSMPTRKTRSR
jgi:hypothetical protein